MTDDEIRAIVAQLAGPFSTWPPILGRLATEPDFETVAAQLHACGLAMGSLGWIVTAVAPDRRGAIGIPFGSDPDPVVRAGMFYAWGLAGEGVDTQARFLAPRWTFDWAKDPLLVDLLHLGLRDPVARVRDGAARLAYLMRAGHHVADQLRGNLDADEPSAWSAAALGTTSDDESLAILRALVDGTDEQLAGMAIRGLAGRRDGHADVLEAADDRRRHVRWSAAMSIGLIATDIDPSVLADLDRIADDELRVGVVHYRARSSRATSME